MNDKPTPQPRDAASSENDSSQFLGFSTKDGVTIETAPPPASPKKAPAPKADAPAEESEGGVGAADASEGGEAHKSAQKRIDKAVAKQRAAERRADAAEASYRSLEQRLQALERGSLTQPATQRNDTPKSPDPKDYDGGEYDARYLADVARFHAEQAAQRVAQQARAESAQTATAQQQQAAQRDFERKRDDLMDRGAAKFDDFEEIVGDSDVRIPQAVAELILDSDFGVEIAYELASDPDAQRKVSAMTPGRQAAWVGRKEAEFSSKAQDADDGAAAPSPKVSKAPPAPSYTPSGRGGTPQISAATPDFAAFERMVEGQNKRQ